MISAVLFDFDGTLVHSAPGILAGFRATLAAAGVPAVEAVDERVIGPPLLVTLRRLTGLDAPDELDRLAAAFRATYDAHGVLEADAYEGLADVLAALAAARRRAFVVTNKRNAPARAIAGRLGILPQLEDVYSLDSLTPPAPRKAALVAHVLRARAIAPGTAVMVGDSAEDAEAAAANDLPFVAVAYGYGTPHAFEGARPVATLERLADLPAVLRRLD
ncbi:MAG TPA: HAD hydrolase-like protein [Gemmatimonadaceae bacterium]|nr:HAD hydrolase-like protein [Gemmatimonadaceae bacterium]